MANPAGVYDFGDDLAVPMTPVFGMWSFMPGQEVPPGASPDMLNCVVRKAMLTKRPGYALQTDAMSALNGRIVGLYSTQDANNTTYLVAITPTSVYQHTAGAWSILTGPGPSTTPLTGSDERLFQFETSQNAIVFSQGVDQVMRWPFTGAYAILNASCPAARYMTRFADRLYIAHTVEATVTQPFRIRRSVAADHTNWTGVGSGFHDLTEFPYQLRNIRKLHNQLAVYAEQAIHLGTRTEDPSAPARFDPVVTDIGLYAPFTLRGRNDIHYFVGNDDFYQFNGVNIESFGWQIRDEIYPVLNIDKLHMMFAEITYDSQEYLAFICTGGSTTPNMVWVYNFGRNVHYPWSVSGPCCSTRHRQDAGFTIDQLVGTIDDQTYEIDATGQQDGYPALLTGHTDGKIYKWSSFYKSDAGTTIPCRWTSKDFTAKDLGGKQFEEITLKEVHIRYKETGVAATLRWSYSKDGGASWDGVDEMALTAGTSSINVASVYRSVTGDQVRFKFENDTATETFQIIEIIPVFELPESRISSAS